MVHPDVDPSSIKGSGGGGGAGSSAAAAAGGGGGNTGRKRKSGASAADAIELLLGSDDYDGDFDGEGFFVGLWVCGCCRAHRGTGLVLAQSGRQTQTVKGVNTLMDKCLSAAAAASLLLLCQMMCQTLTQVLTRTARETPAG